MEQRLDFDVYGPAGQERSQYLSLNLPGLGEVAITFERYRGKDQLVLSCTILDPTEDIRIIDKRGNDREIS